VTWRQGTKGNLSARLATFRVRAGDGLVWGNSPIKRVGEKRYPAFRGLRRLRACPPCGKPSSDGYSLASTHPCDALNADAASNYRPTSKCPGSVRASLQGHVSQSMVMLRVTIAR